MLHGNLTYVRAVSAGTFRRGKLLSGIRTDRQVNKSGHVSSTLTMVEALANLSTRATLQGGNS